MRDACKKRYCAVVRILKSYRLRVRITPYPTGVADSLDSDVALGWGKPGGQSRFGHPDEELFLFWSPTPPSVPHLLVSRQNYAFISKRFSAPLNFQL
jgi:hypothetical protein